MNNSIDRPYDLKSLLLFLAGTLLVALVVFRVVIPSDVVLFTTDNNIGDQAYGKMFLPQGFFSYWAEYPLLGGGGILALNWTYLLLTILPLNVYVDWIHGIDLGLASLFLVLFLRERKVNWAGCALAGLTAYWLGSNLTLTYAGHNSKFAVLMFSAAALWCIEMAVQRRRVAWAVLAGGAAGAMFLEQPDLALFFGLFVGAYAIYALLRTRGLDVKGIISMLIPMLVVALLVGGMALLNIYVFATEGKAPTTAEDPQMQASQQWEFATQWSWPPEETIAFVAPGITGWRSGEPEGPYRGRMGRSAGWEKTKQGFRNFKLENTYLGAIPVAFGIFSVFFLFVGRRKDEEWSKDVAFWGVATVLALLLAFGKYFPLYRVFYALPGVSSIRNPNKFLQVFQVGLAILAGYGLHLAISTARTWSGETAKKVKAFAIVIAILGGLMLFFGLVTYFTTGARERAFQSDGWGTAAPVIVANIYKALFHGGLLTLLAAGGLGLLVRPTFSQDERSLKALPWVLIVVVILDVLSLSKHYIKPMSLEANVGENVVTRYLKQNLNHQTTYMLNQNGFYNHWLSIAFPYHGIRAFNVTQMPRMPEDYKQFLAAVGNAAPRLWQLSSVGYVFAPVQTVQQIQKDPNMAAMFEPVIGFNVIPVQGGMAVAQGNEMQPAQHYLLKFKSALPRYSFLKDWEVLPDDVALRMLPKPEFDPRKRVIVSSDTPLEAKPPVSGSGTLRVDEHKRTRIALTVVSDSPGIVLATTKFDPKWSAKVDGRAVDLLRCNYIEQGVYVDAGTHEVVLQYSSEMRSLWIQIFGMTVCLGAAIWIAVGSRRS
ncbi:MAG: YfhO family protein [Verrucomicrobia bacterium]|nr:YfhO family protein [Verrucomicrobiota bacterium]